jgi:peptide/nickel transport system substrate-binding protein
MISPYAPSSFGYPPDTRGFAPVFAMQPCLEGFIDADLHGNLRPKLALSWVTAPDKSSITFTLRKGVKFHDGTDFHAQAAKWNFDNWIKQGTGMAAAFASVDVVDDYTIRINLKYYSNTILTSMNSLMISPTAVQKNGIDWAKTNPVGTGPFKMTKFVRDTEMDFVRFDDYWGDKAKVNAMKFFYIVDATTARMAFQGGDGKVLEGAVPRTAFDLQALGFSVASRRGPLMNLIPDSKNADSPFSKLKVREAVEYAINRQSIANTLGYGWWEAVNQPDAPEQFGHIDKLVGRSYDPAKAKQLLAEAGFPNGFSTRIISQPALSQDSLVAIQSDLAAVGIIVALDVVSAAKWAEIRISGWDNGLFFVTHGATDFNYCAYLERYYGPKTTYYPVMQHPAGWDDLMNQMLKASEPDQMKALAQKAVQMHVDEAMVIPLWIEAECYVLDPRVHDAGYGTHGDGFGWDTNMVWISKEK